MKAKTRLFLKIMVLPMWMFSSLLTMAFAVWVLDGGESNVRAMFTSVERVEANPSYDLYAALPKKGDVLGQRVDYTDIRAYKLHGFLEFYHSPMVGSEMAFVEAADKYNLPWTLLPAIACKESGCGRVIPVGSFNAFGWAVYTGQNSGAEFDSWEHAIDGVAKGLRENYFDNGLDTVPKIETRYTPPSANSHHGWQTTVEFFMDELENW